MSKLVSSLLLLVIIFLGWKNFALIQEKFAAPCEKPITYSIGTFDTRFNLSRSDFLLAVKQAEKLWEEPLGRELFSHVSEKPKLAVNLVYDYRQEVTEELDQIEDVVRGDEATYKSLEARYEILKREQEALKANYDARVSAFNHNNARYEQMVALWNASDRSSQTQFTELEVARRDLEQEVKTLKTVEAQLNAAVREINSLVNNLNRLARQLNLKVREYNTIGASRGETFAGGTYTSDESGERIDIFEFKNHEKLVRILAHELGHALGLDHVDDPQAIMYYLNEDEAERLTEADLTALKTLCKMN